MNKEEMLKRLKDIHLLYSMPMMAQNMRQEHYAIVEYEKLAYEQQAIIDQLTNNWNELRQHIKDYIEEWQNSDDELVKGKCDMARDILYDMQEIKEGNNVSSRN